MDYARQYGRMHESGKRFPGYSLGAYVDSIAKLVEAHQPERLLDYGCGKGFQYLVRRYHERWGGLLPHCFDVGIPQLAELPPGPFGGVICTDVLEHIEKVDLPHVLDEIFDLVGDGGFAFLGVSCRPTRKTLPQGGDVHCTVERPDWWVRLIESRIRDVGREGKIAIRIEFDMGDPPHFTDVLGSPWVSPLKP
jgi:SAM-dependent methyltransferase